MQSRRQFIGRGLSAVALGALARRGLALAPSGGGVLDDCAASGALSLKKSRPFADVPLLPASVPVDGMPFASRFSGDGFSVDFPFHTCENCFKNGQPPEPTEEVDVAIVGGGISGLSTAYMLRRHSPVLFELHDRFGGAAKGEHWAGTYYSLGNAYVITPDPGSFLEGFYQELGLDRVVRVDDEPFQVELAGQIIDNFLGKHPWTPEERVAIQRYAEVVSLMADRNYVDIPLPDGKDNRWIYALDYKTFKQDLEEQMGLPVPPLLAAAIQAYFYSSFDAGYDEISAACGWNFLAAEEYGRWVFPGGTAYMSDALFRRLAAADNPDITRPACYLRAGCKVVDVRLTHNDRVQVTYEDSNRRYHGLLARRVVMCCPKFLCKYIMVDLPRLDVPKLDAMHRIETNAYIVANVLLDAPITRDFYDVFLLRDGNFPMTVPEVTDNSQVVDMLNGHYARQEDIPRSVLTLYWPLPFSIGRFRLIAEGAWHDYAKQLVPQIRMLLETLKVPERAVRQVRMTRWGHAMPIARPGFIAEGSAEHVRRPFEGKVFFVNQDNWALPAVENCLLDAEIFVPQIEKGL